MATVAQFPTKAKHSHTGNEVLVVAERENNKRTPGHTSGHTAVHQAVESEGETCAAGNHGQDSAKYFENSNTSRSQGPMLGLAAHCSRKVARARSIGILRGQLLEETGDAARARVRLAFLGRGLLGRRRRAGLGCGLPDGLLSGR